MITDQQRQDLELMFLAKNFEGMWGEIDSEYKQLGFSDPISDADRISEYKWIVQQLRKYMFSKRESILSLESYEDMLEVVMALINNSTEYGDDRKSVVYNFMRDHWLIEVYQYLYALADSEEDE